jgi:hypothetical protein
MERTQEVYPVKVSKRSTTIVANHLGNENQQPRSTPWMVMTPYLGWQQGMADRAPFGPQMRA